MKDRRRLLPQTLSSHVRYKFSVEMEPPDPLTQGLYNSWQTLQK